MICFPPFVKYFYKLHPDCRPLLQSTFQQICEDVPSSRKHTIPTMGRKSLLVFLTLFYEDNLASSATLSTLSRSLCSGSDSSSPSGSNGDLSERRKNPQTFISSVQTNTNQDYESKHTEDMGEAESKSSYTRSAYRLSGAYRNDEREKM